MLLGYVFPWGKPYRNVIVTPATTSDCITNRSLLSNFSLRRKSQRASNRLQCGHKCNDGSKGDFPKTSSLVSICEGQSRKEKPSGDRGLVTNLKPLTAQCCMVSVLPCSLRAASKTEISCQPVSCIFHSLATSYFSSSRGLSGFCRPSILFGCPEMLLLMSPWLDVLPPRPQPLADPESRGTAASSAPRDRVQPITICSSSTGPGQTDSTNSLGWRGLLQVTCTVLPIQSRANWKIRSNLRTRQQANPDTADTLGRMLRANCPRTAMVSPG